MPDANIYGFDLATCKRIVRTVRRVEEQPFNDSRRRGQVRPPIGGYIAQTPSGGIPPLSGSTPGSATVALYALNSSGVLTATGETVTAYNPGKTAMGGGKWTLLALFGGVLWAVYEDCT